MRMGMGMRMRMRIRRNVVSLRMMTVLSMVLTASVLIASSAGSPMNSLIPRTQHNTKITMVAANWPNKKPFVDRCNGVSQRTCNRSPRFRNDCLWSQNSYPACFNKQFFRQKPPQLSLRPIDIVTRFFEFSYGVHLAEGSTQRWLYNYDLEKCGRACLRSAEGGEIRCLSFDFYPFENPLSEAPYGETVEKGMCILNSDNKNSARLRNEDQGKSDAELFYKSHFVHRPFSKLDGYYEIRDPRGGQIAKMLDYDGLEQLELQEDINDEARQVQPLNVWPKTRWGVYHLEIPPPLHGEFFCAPDGDFIPADGKDALPEEPVIGSRFTAGFTPVNDFQSCHGRVNKTYASTICEELGGTLCTDNQLQELNGRNIGCGYDKYPIWSIENDEGGGNKFVRCCVNYGIFNSCALYNRDNLDFCQSKVSEPDCVNDGSGLLLQKEKGFGKMLDEIREACANGQGTCEGEVRNWHPRDNCIWCLDRDNDNAGACYAGNDFGICPRAREEAQALFELRMKSSCERETVCRAVAEYPHLSPRFQVPTKSPTVSPTSSPTRSPSRSPTNAPTASPSPSPTKFPTRSPTHSPSKSPTKSPSRSPTRAPTKAPTMSPSKSPSKAPTHRPTQSPTLSPSTSAPTSFPTFPTESPTELPSTEGPTVQLNGDEFDTVETEPETGTPTAQPSVQAAP